MISKLNTHAKPFVHFLKKRPCGNSCMFLSKSGHKKKGPTFEIEGVCDTKLLVFCTQTVRYTNRQADSGIPPKKFVLQGRREHEKHDVLDTVSINCRQ